MKVYDTSGTLHNWTPKSNPRFNKSSYHTSALEVLKKIYPLDSTLEEVAVPGEHLFLDIFIPSRKLVVEVNGEQHYKFNSHFYESENAFYQAKQRDLVKVEWCKLNGFDLVVLDYNNNDKWEQLILER